MNGRHNTTPMKNLKIAPFFICVYLGIFLINGMWILVHHAGAAESQSRTESNCTIGMAKGKTKTECHVPILKGCTVAQFPGYNEPWAEATKGGATSCQFNAKKTDWKTSIVGTCEACKTEQCTGRFTVLFNCADNVPSASPAFPQKK